MVLYDDPNVTYDDPGVRYDGLDQGVVSLVVGPHGSESQQAQVLAERSLSVNVNVHGNARGTMNATLIDPVVVPQVDDLVYLDVEDVRLYDGVVKTRDVDEIRGAHVTVQLGAQAEASYNGIPGAAPFDVDDQP